MQHKLKFLVRKNRKSLLFIAITLLIGSSIYILFRPPLSWFPHIYNWNSAFIDLSILPTAVSAFIKYHLSDVLWALAFAETVKLITNNFLLGAIIALVSTVFYETMQYLGYFRGTGDIYDVIFVLMSLIIYLILNKGRKTDEKHDT